MRILTLVLAFAALLSAQEKADKYDGPRPAKPDVPFLVHADNLVETEASEAKEQEKKDEIIYTVAGEASPAKTPVAEPIFLFLSEKIQPDAIELYRLEPKDGARQLVMPKKPKKDSPRPARLTVTRLAERLYRIEVNEGMGLENGEYSFSPRGSNQVFCFSVY
jgi:hypothetical protein